MDGLDRRSRRDGSLRIPHTSSHLSSSSPMSRTARCHGDRHTKHQAYNLPQFKRHLLYTNRAVETPSTIGGKRKACRYVHTTVMYLTEQTNP